MGVVGVEAESCRCDWRGTQGTDVKFTSRTVRNVQSTAHSATSLCQPQGLARTQNTTRSGRQIRAVFRKIFNTEDNPNAPPGYVTIKKHIFGKAIQYFLFYSFKFLIFSFFLNTLKIKNKNRCHSFYMTTSSSLSTNTELLYIPVREKKNIKLGSNKLRQFNIRLGIPTALQCKGG